MKIAIPFAVFALLTGCGGSGGAGGVEGPEPGNGSPSINDPGSLAILEGGLEIANLTAIDPDRDSLTFTIVAGDDRALFRLTAAGALSFAAAPDYEIPADANANNVYEVSVQVSDGSLTDLQSLTVNVTNAFEGRVVDGPISNASVSIDLNGNGVLDSDETSGVTDRDGYFKVPEFSVSGAVNPKVIATGGTDTFTEKVLTELTLISDVPSDMTKAANVTPLTTVLSTLETEAEKVQALQAMGITATFEDLLTTDTWAAAQAGDGSAKATQRVNHQIGLLLQTAGTLSLDAGASLDASLRVSKTVAEQIANAALAADSLDLAASSLAETVLVQTLAAVPPATQPSAAVITAIAVSVAGVNAVYADPDLDPVSASGAVVAQAAQNSFQESVAGVISGVLSVNQFEQQVEPETLIGDADLAGSLDTDADGIPDVIDSDDDGDGYPDSSDAFPLLSGEWLDTDLDGIGNNQDRDDDGDGVADGNDAFPLDRDESLDSDGDGAGNNADPDDDGDGYLDIVDAFPLQSGEWLDTDGDGVGNNADSDDDGDGIGDVNDALPLNPANAIDTDGDGVLDIFDVQPNDDSVTKALQVNLTDVESLGLGEKIDSTAEVAAARIHRLERGLADRLLAAFLEILTPNALANDTLAAQTNAITWDDDGDIVGASILSSDTFFVAEANVSPDGEYVYLLTSDHIQTRTPGLDPEVCTVYRVEIASMTFVCLLKTEDGDVEPKSLAPSQSTDFAHRGITFRADGAAIMRGFDYTLESNDGVANVSVWFLSPDGNLTALIHENPYEASAAYWLTDDTIAVAQHAYGDALDAGMPNDRLAIYSADTLEQVAVISEGVGNLSANSPRVRKGNDLYWDSRVLRGDSLLIEESGGEGYPLLDANGERMLFLTETPENRRIFSLDGEIELQVTDGKATWYEGVKQSGSGTDIKYPPVGFSGAHLAFRKTYAPAEPIQTLDGVEFSDSTTYELSNGQGSVEIQSATDIFLVRPAADHSGDLTIDYEVLTASGALAARSLTISGQTIENWRNDGADSAGEGVLYWASPSPHREGFCVYEFETTALQCINFTDYQSLAVDMEYFRSTRYDAGAVYPDGSGNAFPGVQNTLLTGGQIRVFFKDSFDNTYYQAQANVADFMTLGRQALSITPAVNGAGDSNIVSDAIRIKPAPFLEISDATMTSEQENQVTVDFGRSLSAYAALPTLSLAQGTTLLQLAEDVEWLDDRRRAVLSYSQLGLNPELDIALQVDGPIFLPNQIRRHRLAEPLSLAATGDNAFVLADDQVVLGDYDSDSGRMVASTLNLVSASGALSIDAREAPFNKDNIDSALGGSAFVAPTISLSLSQLPVGEGNATMTLVVTDGADGQRSAGERQISVKADVTWSGNGLDGDITVPAQTVTSSYVTSLGSSVELEVENFSADVLQVTSNGAQVPASLDVRLAGLLQRFDALIPTGLVKAGDYHVKVMTDLPLANVGGEAITQLNLIFTIGD